MQVNTFPFRRMTKALLVPVGVSPTNFPVPAGFVKADYTAFAVYNPNTCDVGLRGTSKPTAPDAPLPTTAILAAVEGDDWLFPPKFWGVFSTQYPLFMSARAFETPGFPAPVEAQLKPLRIWYGYGA